VCHRGIFFLAEIYGLSLAASGDNDNRQQCIKNGSQLPLWHGKLSKWMKRTKN
jgi:hypothetical protein